ncbi:multisubunit potassium/proton antiporter PhaF subunit [Rhodovulum imhoffii]|uniref:Multisubunit potassium/proton antiporter PhaF subunit n=1 Tax=Rhodovulum imhoffii TaxID=365340 RepID=A0A2T5BVJ3_9RHOB|nr:K+/H+ antiporter subunit F [Rhodovulum imhoffii]MBK5932835.1 K+/H+ antiporter subunit F [Rhodovulum imhoffii]PTN03596.1 multisubunit potassium/proton antiporter PhaF subunit [Rhodovulum imhoffii]
MIEYALYFAIGCFAVALMLNLYRIVNAPVLGDRILALDTMVINAIALLSLFGVLKQTSIYFEASMIFAMTGFVSTVSYTRFMLRGDIIE